jgi:hypothetical protein
MLPSKSAEAPGWYYRPVGVLFLLFVVLGPLGLPYLWKSPSFSRAFKAVLTGLVIAYTALLIEETIRMFRVATSEMHALGVLPS